jgi:hypothetical protein
MLVQYMGLCATLRQMRSYKMEFTTFENAKYVTDIDGNDSRIVVDIDGVTTWVAVDQNNRVYREIMRQVTEGTLTIADADPIAD